MVIEEATDRSSRAIEVRHQLRILILHYLCSAPQLAHVAERHRRAEWVLGFIR
jgi:hypothetical protein